MTWFKVDDRFHSHPKAAAASLAAIGLWSVAGSWASDHLTDGDVPEHMIPSLARGATELADELVTCGLWRRTKSGYRFHQWAGDSDGTPRNPTRSEEMARRANKAIGGAIGNHRRWHVARGISDPKCDYCQRKPVSHDRSDTDGVTESGANPPTRPDPTTEEQPPKPPAAKAARRGRPTDDPNFDRFWEAYPRKEGKGQALDKWKQHIVNGNADPDVVVRGAARYRDDPRRKPDFTKLPATWLNGLCWEDQPAEKPRSRTAWWDN